MGVNSIGPIYVHSADATSSHKVWICLYACYAVRAIHLEIVHFSISLEPQAIHCKEEIPKRFTSDNGKTFKSAAKLLSAITSHEEIQQYLSGAGIEWVFNVERAQ